MATFHHPDAAPSPTAARRLHPADRSSQPLTPGVLAEIAAGLARTVAPHAIHEGRSTLLVTAAYEATVEVITPDGCQMVDAANGLALSFSVATGQLIVWTADDGTEVLSPGDLCSIRGGERVQVVNVGPDRAVVVLVQARDERRTTDLAGFSPCAAAVA